ncbi:MAG: hypothetical protein GXX99_06410 [Clostridiales bacterium]|nr:hypothetical protein [Clostridiales bacterium]
MDRPKTARRDRWQGRALAAGALVLSCLLLWPLLTSLPFPTREDGFLTPSLTLDGQSRTAPADLIYAEGGSHYLSAQGLAALLADQLSVEAGDYEGAPALLVSCGPARAAYLENGRLMTYTEGRADAILTPSSRRPILLRGDWYLPIDRVSVGFCCLALWDAPAGQLTLYSFERALQQTSALAAGYNLSLSLTGSLARDRYLLDQVFPVSGEGGATLLDRDEGPLFAPADLLLTRDHYGYLQVGADNLRGLFSLDGVQLLPPQYRSIDFFDLARGLLITVDPDQQQRLFACAEGGILALTDRAYRRIGQGYLPGGDGGVTLIDGRLAAVQDERGLWGAVLLQTGRLVVPCRYDAIGGYMDVGAFHYREGSRAGLLSGRLPEPILLFEDRGLIVQKDGLFGVCDLSGRLIVEPRFEALFRLQGGDRPGWYGRTGETYSLVWALPEAAPLPLDAQAQLSLADTTLMLLQRGETAWRVADLASGALHLLPPATGAALFRSNPVFSTVRTTVRSNALAAAYYPTPPYAHFPILPLEEGQLLEEGAARYPALLFERMSCSGGLLGLEEAAVEGLRFLALGDREATLELSCTVAPQRDPLHPAVGAGWGLEGQRQGHFSLTLTLYEAVDEQGRVLLCAAAPAEGGNPFTAGLPEVAVPVPTYRYSLPALEHLYTELLKGAISQQAFYEDPDYTYIEARYLDSSSGDPAGYYYRIDLLRLPRGEAEPSLLFEMPGALGSLRPLALHARGLLVSTWHHVFASSGWEGPIGLLEDEGFVPLLEQASVLGLREGRLYAVGSLQGVRGLYALDLDTLEAALLCAMDEDAFSTDTRSLVVQAITQEACYLAWPSVLGERRYEVLRFDLADGGIERLFP